MEKRITQTTEIIFFELYKIFPLFFHLLVHRPMEKYRHQSLKVSLDIGLPSSIFFRFNMIYF